MARSAFSPSALLHRLTRRSDPAHNRTSGQSPSAFAFGQKEEQAGSSSLTTAHQAASLVARLPELVVQADHIAATLYAGQHGQRRAGWGDTFWQYRQAQPGEPSNHIDWRQSARSTHAYVRETEAESAQTIVLWCDLSPSMNWRSSAALPFKQERAILLLLSMAGLFLRNGERVRLLTPTGIAVLPSNGTPLERLALGFAHLAASPTAADGTTTEFQALPPAELVPRRAHLLIASDFLCDDQTLGTCLNHLAGRPVRAHLIQVADLAERALPYNGRVAFEGLEHESPIDLPHVQTLRPDYEALVAARDSFLANQAAQHGHDLTLHCTQDAPLPRLLNLHEKIGGKLGPMHRGIRI